MQAGSSGGEVSSGSVSWVWLYIEETLEQVLRYKYCITMEWSGTLCWAYLGMELQLTCHHRRKLRRSKNTLRCIRVDLDGPRRTNYDQRLWAIGRKTSYALLHQDGN
jgi:hypothetical protein